MKIIWGAALALAIFSTEALSGQPTPNPLADQWSCDYKLNGHPQTQKWIVANGRITAPSGGLRVVLNNDHVLIGFVRFREGSDDPFDLFVIIEKKTGTYLNIDTAVMSAVGKSHNNTSEPSVEIGHCTLLGG